MKLIALPFIFLIKIYQRTLSVWISMWVGPKCKYYPTCSNYAVSALERFSLAGLPLIVWRLMRCNPFSHGGVDYVSNNYFENYVKNPENPQKQSKLSSSGVNR
ncbi:MAG: membrane protein insertion efficiency factor YidD [Candidatus Nanopelagicaceae bacterium]|nr:membrane protein insertion efficiency factor YidD [Candidatus Nanopelagicaceae bacterium]